MANLTRIEVRNILNPPLQLCNARSISVLVSCRTSTVGGSIGRRAMSSPFLWPNDSGSPAHRLLARLEQHLVRRSLAVHSGRSGRRSWPTRRSTMKHALYAEILVNVRPVNSLAGSDETKLCPLCGLGFSQAPGPSQRHADYTLWTRLELAKGAQGNFRDPPTISNHYATRC